MSHYFSQTSHPKCCHLILCLLFLTTITIQAQNVGIGTTNPNYQLTLGGTQGVFAVENTGTFFAKNTAGVYEPYFWPRWNDNRTIINFGQGGFQLRDRFSTTRLQILENGKVGIGTENPGATLHVLGNVRIEDGLQAAGKVLMSNDNGVGTWTYYQEIDPQVNCTGTNRISKWNGSSLVETSIWENNSNIGIGNALPQGRLHIVTNGQSGNIRHLILQAENLESGNSTALELGKDNSTSNMAELKYTYDNDGSPNNRLSVGFSGLDPFVAFIAEGNVGIGTMTPTTKLDVVGQIKIQDGTQGTGKVLTSNADGVAHWQTATLGIEIDPQVSSATSNMIPRWDGGALIDGSIIDNGNIGIGTTTPNYQLTLGGTQNVFGVENAASFAAKNTDGIYETYFWPRWNDDRTLLNFGEGGLQLRDHLSNVRLEILNNGDVIVGDPYLTTELKVLGNVGIGFTEPTHKLTLGGSNDVFAVQNSASFTARNIDGNYETYFIPRWSDNRTIINYGSGGFQVRDNGNNVRFHVSPAGNVGIGSGTPGGLFELTLDQGRKPSTSTWTIPSDARVKNIEGHYPKGLNEILQLNPILYHYKNTDTKTFSPEVLESENVGLTAQEVQEVFPEAVGVDPDGTLNLNMHSILIAQLNAIKELNAMITSQQQQIDTLTEKLDEVMRAGIQVIHNSSGTH